MSKEYKISVVTPFHNVDLRMFEKSVESMKAQTYGFENIQWIIVVHNSEQKYLDGVNKLVGQYENVLIKVLNNDIRNPSSPRNYGMQFATGKYIGFLDGDDSYTLNVFSEAIPALENTNAQMVSFRREYELDDPNCTPVTEIVLWNQMQKAIVMNKGHWDEDKMFTGLWGFVTSKIYDREFLKENEIYFDETMTFVEDFMFNAQVIGSAERIVYMPQLIGYHYFINGSSIVQSGGKKTGEQLIGYAKGLAKMFLKMTLLGLPINQTLTISVFYLVNYIINATNITLEDLQEIKNLIGSYIERLKQLKPSKIYSAGEVEEMYRVVRLILTPELLLDKNSASKNQPAEAKEMSLLLKIVDDNKNTDLGENYNFSEIKTVADFQDRVPLSVYDDYSNLIRLTTNIGETNIFTAYPIKYYNLTSCSMGVPHYIPCTENQLADFMENFDKTVSGKKNFLLLESLPRDTKYNDNTYLDSISGALLHYYFEKNPKAHEIFTAPKELFFPTEYVDINHPRLIFALSDENVEQIVSPFTWGIVGAFTYLEKNWEQICTDIERGELYKNLPISDSFRNILNERLSPNPKRANELREIFSAGFNEPVAKKIWKNLQKIIAVGTGSFEIYADKMRRYIGDIPHSNWIYAASESLIATSLEDDSDRYILNTDKAFFEFMAIDGSEKIFTADELENDKAYEIILTNKSGFYRYRLGDIIRVVDASSDAPIIAFAYRKNQVGKLGGFVLTENDVYHALKTIEKAMNFEIADFAYWEDVENNSYKILIEPTITMAEKISEISLADVAKLFNHRLGQINPKFADALEKTSLNPCTIQFNQQETHLLYRDMECFRRKSAPDQIKPIHFIDNIVKEKFFLNNIL